MDRKTLEFIKLALRRASQRWKPICETRKRARRAYTGPNRRQKYEFKCSNCKHYFPQREVEVHHKIPVGGLKTLEDLPGFVTRLFCKRSDLCLLCKGCHRAVGKSTPI